MTSNIISNDRIEMLLSMIRAMRLSLDEANKLISGLECQREEIEEEKQAKIQVSGPFFDLAK